MDFVTAFPKSKCGNDAIFGVIDKLTKVAHFLPIKESITAAQLAELYTSRIFSLHGIPQLISSDRGSIFTSMFWDSFHKAMGTNIRFSTAFHPQTSGQVERVNQIFEDMLRACVEDITVGVTRPGGAGLPMMVTTRSPVPKMKMAGQ